MFLLLLIALLAAVAVHSFRGERSIARTGELLLLYVLVGYCGLPMVAVSVGLLAAPEAMAEMLPVGPPTAVVSFFAWAYLGMSLMATLALWFRGSYLVGAALCWAVYFLGATVVHLQGAGGGHASHGGVLATLATHLSISVLLAVGLGLSGLLTRRR